MRFYNIIFCSLYLTTIPFTSINAASIKQFPIINNATLSSWGYKQAKSAKYPRYYCNSKTITPASIRYQSIKSLKPLANSNTFPRFNLVVETYNSVPLKDSRFRQLEGQRGNSSTKISKSCLLRRITSEGKNIYILHTDAALFSRTIMNSFMQRWKRTLKLK